MPRILKKEGQTPLAPLTQRQQKPATPKTPDDGAKTKPGGWVPGGATQKQSSGWSKPTGSTGAPLKSTDGFGNATVAGTQTSPTTRPHHPRLGGPTTPFPDGDVRLPGYRTTESERAAVVSALGDWGQTADFIGDIEDLHRRDKTLREIPMEDLMALKAYSFSIPGMSFKELNTALRSQDPVELSRLEPLLKGSASALAQLPPHDGTVFSGARLDDATLAQYTKGAVVCERAFFSTSTNEGIAERFKKNVMFVVESNGKGRGIDAFSLYPGEGEVLFPPGSRFKVLERTTGGDGVTTIRLGAVD